MHHEVRRALAEQIIQATGCILTGCRFTGHPYVTLNETTGNYLTFPRECVWAYKASLIGFCRPVRFDYADPNLIEKCITWLTTPESLDRL